MSKLWALFVEDETGPATIRFQREIEKAGFDVARASSASEARAHLEEVASDHRIVDLVVLDRKLPEELGDRAVEGTGDRLFEEIEALHPDTPIIVLTGFSDEDFVTLVLQRKNALDLGLPESIQRIRHIKKSKALKFRDALQLIGGALQRTEDIALEGATTTRSARRVLKRVGQLYGGAVIHARPATGGLSSSAVWLCEVVASDGRRLTSVVVKIGPHNEPRPSGGFMASVPAANAAQPMHIVGGACGGLGGHVAPLAGQGASSLADILAQDEARAVQAAELVVGLLDQIPEAIANLPLHEFVAPLIEWPCAEELASAHEIALPSRHLPVQTRLGCLHGDLHPGNVLLVSGRPVFIDFDRQQPGSMIIDSLSLALGAVFNKSGPLRDTPPTLELVERCVTGTIDPATWFGGCTSSWSTRGYGERERWSALLAFALRQLKYDDVLQDDARCDLAVKLAKRAAVALNDS